MTNTMQNLTEKQIDMLIGTLLGDGHLSTRNAKTWSYRCLHSEKQLDYLQHKYDLLKDFCLTGPTFQKFKTAQQKTLGRYYFNTRRLAVFQPYAQLFYFYDHHTQRWVKQIPINIEDILTPAALAYWFMDDGDQKWKNRSAGIRFSTNSYTFEECSRLQKTLTDKYCLKVSLQKAGISKANIQQHRIYVSSSSYSTFRDLISPYLHPSMLYKMPFNP